MELKEWFAAKLRLFDDNGEFLYDKRLLFENGDVLAREFIYENYHKYPANSDIVRAYYASLFAEETHGNYSSETLFMRTDFNAICHKNSTTKKVFYRVGNITSEQGLWYDFKGNFTGLIHDKFNFCKNSKLPMPFDLNLVGWLSATDSLEDLYNWFSEQDIERLKEYGYKILIYEADEYKAYNNHWIIKQSNAKLILQDGQALNK